MKNTYEIDEDSSTRIRCEKFIHNTRAECGLWVWAVRLRGKGHIVVEVTERDLKHLALLTTSSDKLDYLAIFGQLERVR